MDSKPKVVVRIVGGIGNQLFSYAAARRLAVINEAELVIDHVSGFRHDSIYQRRYQLDHFKIPCRRATAFERLEPLSRIRRYLKRRANRVLPFPERSYIQQEGVDFDWRLLDVKPRGTLYLEGYWQSEAYFKDIESTIRADLQIKPPDDADNREMSERIGASRSVAVHVRFFDQPGEPGPNNAPVDYYCRAVAQMDQKVRDAHYFVFSDQPVAAQSLLPLAEDRMTVVDINKTDENAYADLWLMVQCKHFIIANSTFSWWGAWLAARPTSVIIAPRQRLVGEARITSWGFSGLLPSSWTLI